MVDIFAAEESVLNLSGQLQGEIAFVIVKGSIQEAGEKVEAGQMLISKTEDHCKIFVSAGTRLLLFGGAPLPQEHFLLWNFVSHSKTRLQEAKQDWINREFPSVPDDETYIPFPGIG